MSGSPCARAFPSSHMHLHLIWPRRPSAVGISVHDGGFDDWVHLLAIYFICYPSWLACNILKGLGVLLLTLEASHVVPPPPSLFTMFSWLSWGELDTIHGLHALEVVHFLLNWASPPLAWACHSPLHEVITCFYKNFLNTNFIESA